MFIATYYTLFQDNLITIQISETSALLKLASSELANPVYFLDVEEIDQVLDKLTDNPNILSSFVFSPEGKIISDFETKVFSNTTFVNKMLQSNDVIYEIHPTLLTISAPIIVDNIIGFVVIEYSLDSVNQILTNSFLGVLGISFIAAGFAGLISYFSNKKITDFLSKITKFSEDISSEKPTEKIPLSNIDEIDNLHTALETMRQNLESSKHELLKTERLSSMGELAARLAHDIRNPLTVIRGSIEIIFKTQKEQLPPKTITYLEMIKTQSERIHHQVNDVLDFVRSKPLNPSTVVFQSFLKDTLESIQIPENISIIQPTNEIKFTIDTAQIRIVLVNLITNAIQSFNDNTGKIDIRISETDDSIQIEVEDSGPGIDPKNFARIFDPLYTTKQEGTGLGLASCQTIVKQHGGKIQVQNGKSGGALFIITLPKKLPL